MYTLLDRFINTHYRLSTDMTEVRILDRGGATFRTVDVGNGRLMPFFGRKTASEIKEIYDNIPSLPLRDDDVLLCTYPKTGTNWMHEVISMVQNRSAERVTSDKVQLMMEAQTQAELERWRSPRVVNTHVHLGYLPRDVKSKHIKTVLVLRNPKDTAVSFYNHYAEMKAKDYEGKWADWLPLYMDGGVEYGAYENYLKGWEDAVLGGLDFPLHVVYYEDMKADGLPEIQRLADFLGVDIDVDLRETIFEKCSFKSMATWKFSDERREKSFKEHFHFFRKGKVGDWTNWFTVAQNEEFDRVWTRRMEGYTMFNFTYQPT